MSQIPIEIVIENIKQNETTRVPLELTPQDVNSTADVNAMVLAADDIARVELRTSISAPPTGTLTSTAGTISFDVTNKIIYLTFLDTATRTWPLTDGALTLYGTLKVVSADGTRRQYSGKDLRVEIEGSYTRS